MAHIKVPEGVPGILSLFAVRPETAKPMCELAEVLLRGPSSLTPGERELIASRVSGLNECAFCCGSHGGAAKHLLGGDEALVAAVVKDPKTAQISPKLKALLAIAAKVQKDGRSVAKDDVAAARKEGATDLEIHDAVLIAAAFCMYNRYVDGLATLQPPAAAYDEMGAHLAKNGYKNEAGAARR